MYRKDVEDEKKIKKRGSQRISGLNMLRGWIIRGKDREIDTVEPDRTRGGRGEGMGKRGTPT